MTTYKRYYLESVLKENPYYKYLERLGITKAEFEEGLSKAEEVECDALSVPVRGMILTIGCGYWDVRYSEEPDKRVFRLNDQARKRLIQSGFSLREIRKAEAERKTAYDLNDIRYYLLPFEAPIRMAVADQVNTFLSDPGDWIFEEDNDGAVK